MQGNTLSMSFNYQHLVFLKNKWNFSKLNKDLLKLMLLHNMHSFRVDIGEIEIDADVGLRHLFDLQPRRVSYVHSFPSKLCLVQLQVFPGLLILT